MLYYAVYDTVSCQNLRIRVSKKQEDIVVFLKLTFLFLTGSLCGWVLELFYRRFFSGNNPERRWINPGFLVGPYVPLYGFGLCILYLLARLPLPGPQAVTVLLQLLIITVALTGIELLAGLLADVMLVFTITMLMAGLAAFGATLTLPGIAGIVLTIGMSVDANVLIFERIREEIRQGLKPLEAVAVGFDRATISIVDSNLTTIIAAAILYQFGTGPVRGFAVTLSLGIVASMFTAIFVSRTAFGLWLGGNDGKKLSI